MSEIVIYQKPTCTTCRQVYEALKASGVDFESVDYCTDPISSEKLRELLRKMGLSARDLLRKNEDVYTRLGLGERELTEAALVDLMARYPRPHLAADCGEGGPGPSWPGLPRVCEKSYEATIASIRST